MVKGVFGPHAIDVVAWIGRGAIVKTTTIKRQAFMRDSMIILFIVKERSFCLSLGFSGCHEMLRRSIIWASEVIEADSRCHFALSKKGH
jgi:hypothetical protein